MLSVADAVQETAKNQGNCNNMAEYHGVLVPILENNS